jgi:hypothetical protein
MTQRKYFKYITRRWLHTCINICCSAYIHCAAHLDFGEYAGRGFERYMHFCTAVHCTLQMYACIMIIPESIKCASIQLLVDRGALDNVVRESTVLWMPRMLEVFV